jgi:hypothetical protein
MPQQAAGMLGIRRMAVNRPEPPRSAVERMKMSLSILGSNHVCEDLLALRRVIAHLADRCRLDLGDRAAVSRFIDGDFSHNQSPARKLAACQELRAMLILLLRLEASSSEDLGIDGLRRLWRQHSEILARFHIREPQQAGLVAGFPGL